MVLVVVVVVVMVGSVFFMVRTAMKLVVVVMKIMPSQSALVKRTASSRARLMVWLGLVFRVGGFILLNLIMGLFMTCYNQYCQHYLP